MSLEDLYQPQSWRRKPGDIPFFNLAHVIRVPDFSNRDANIQVPASEASSAIRLVEHLLPYAGRTLDPTAFLWGAYGTADSADIHQKSLESAGKARKRMLEIRATYRLGKSVPLRSQVDRDATLSTGYLHVDRLKASFRDELKALLLEAAPRRCPGIDIEKLAKLSLGDMLLEHPQFVQDLFDMDKRVMMVVHRVWPVWGTKRRAGVSVCTMRRVPECITDARVHLLPDIRVLC